MTFFNKIFGKHKLLLRQYDYHGKINGRTKERD